MWPPMQALITSNNQRSWRLCEQRKSACLGRYAGFQWEIESRSYLLWNRISESFSEPESILVCVSNCFSQCAATNATKRNGCSFQDNSCRMTKNITKQKQKQQDSRQVTFKRILFLTLIYLCYYICYLFLAKKIGCRCYDTKNISSFYRQVSWKSDNFSVTKVSYN